MKRRHRIGVGLFIALCGIATAVGSELVWIKASHGRPAIGINHTSLTGLLHWSDQHTNSFVKSFAIVIVVAGVLIVIGGLFGWAVPAALFSAIAFIAGGLWLGLYASDHSSAKLQFSSLGTGAFLTIGGSLIALICTSALRRRRT
jgi:small-conductance mechanosensitive channel